MSWNITMLAVHAISLAGCVLLYRSAPCWMQKLVVVGLGFAMLVACMAFGAALAGHDYVRWPIFIVALAIEHIAVLLYVFRLIYQNHIQWNSSEHSHSL